MDIRLPKMYYNEIMSGRYSMLNATASNRDDGYKGMLVVRSEPKSMCSITSNVSGVAYIGIIAAETLIGLSSIHVLHNGVLTWKFQEELNNEIARQIEKQQAVLTLEFTYKQHMVVARIGV